MARSLRSRLAMWIVLACLPAASACGGSSAPPADFRGDPLCQSAAVVEEGTSCELSVTMHGHTYVLSCDFSQGSCSCFRDGREIPNSSGFGGTMRACTLEFFDSFWSDCCGTPE